MKKSQHFLIFFIPFNQLIAQRTCNQVPASKELYLLLSKRPVTNIERQDFIIGCNVTDSIIERILYLLHWEWTKKEIDDALSHDIERGRSFYNIDKKAAKISKGNDSLHKVASDSIIKILKSENLKNFIKYNAFKVDNGLILTAAYLDIKGAIPVLQKGLSDSLHYNRTYVELALARFGEILLQQKVIQGNEYKKELNGREWIAYFYKSARNLLFISTQESIFQLHYWLDTSKIFASIDEKLDTKNAYLAVIALKHAIKNTSFQLIVKNIDDSPYLKMDNSAILAAKIGS